MRTAWFIKLASVTKGPHVQICTSEAVLRGTAQVGRIKDMYPEDALNKCLLVP